MTYICAPIFVTIPRDNGISVDFQPTGGVEVAIPSGPKGLDGVSPTIEVTDILGGHKVTITDVNGTEDFNVMDGGISESDFLKVFPTDTASGAIATFPDGADQVPLKTLTVAIDPVQSGSGDPAPDNVRPISGWTEAKVYRTGVNVWDEVWEKGRLNFDKTSPNWGENVGSDSCIRSKNYISVIPGQNYYCKAFTGATVYAIYYGVDKSPVLTISNQGYQNVANVSFQAPSNAHYIRFYVMSTTVYGNNISFNYPSTYTDYHAYTGQTLPISWQSEAGAVYGGTLDVTTGVLTVKKANIASYNGETLPGEWISDRDVYAPGTTPTTGAQVVYELASYQTVQLTAQQVSSLLGANNVWADTGDVSVIYRADIGLFIDKKLNA